ncbi:MAG: amidohydrolase family protein [Acidimicrobiia bacterium]|nr:amidohydrolase family protein [Acidimicrobiia bacterium]
MNDAIRTCLPPDRHPRTPGFAIPAGAIDTHVHVFDHRYPLAADRGYDPPESTVVDLRQLHAALGFDRVVLTQPSAYGRDNSAILDAMLQLNAVTPDRARSVVSLGMDTTDDELDALDRLGVRGIRVNTDNQGAAPLAVGELTDMAARIATLGWHVEFLFPGEALTSVLPLFDSLPVPISLSHFAYQRAADGVTSPGFKALLGLMRRGNTWMKISGANRVSASDLPPYDDLTAMAHALIDAAPDRIMWGTDWPHPNKFVSMPNDGDLVDGFGQWVTDPALRHKILVDTPELFYRF